MANPLFTQTSADNQNSRNANFSPSKNLSVTVNKAADATFDTTSGDDDPTPRLDAMREQYASIETGYHQVLHAWLGSAYDESLNLFNNETAWTTYISSSQWRENNKKPPKDGSFKTVLKAVLKHLLGYGKEKQKLISKYKNALLYLADIGVGAKDFCERLDEEGGIEKCAAKASRRKDSKADGLPEGTAFDSSPTATIVAQGMQISAEVASALIEWLGPHAPCEVYFKIGKAKSASMTIYDLVIGDTCYPNVAHLGIADLDVED